jgi:hypothetical protein
MTVETVKTRIITKFGSLNKFCNVTGLNLANLSNLFRRKDSKQKQQELKDLLALANKADVTQTEYEITPEVIEKIRVAIVTKYKTYQAFCNQHGFSNTWLSALLNGKHKLVSYRVKELLTILKIEL